jgi:Sel1 repeat-containing protein
VTETLLGLLVWAALALGKQSFPPLALLYFAIHGALFGGVLGLTARAGARHKALGTLVGLLGALAVFGATRFLQELIVLGNPLLAYGSLIKASGGFRWLDLSLYVLGAVACWGPLLLAHWRRAPWLKQAYAGLFGASLFGLGCLLSPLRFQAFGPVVYGLPLLGRVVLFPLCREGFGLWRRLRADRRARAERQQAAGGTAPRAPRTSVDPRARHKARYLEGKAAEHLAHERWLEAGEAFASAADLWPSAKRHLSAASAFARAEEPYRALAHLERVLDDPSHDPSWLEAPELSYLRELEAWAPLAARLKPARPRQRPPVTPGVVIDREAEAEPPAAGESTQPNAAEAVQQGGPPEVQAAPPEEPTPTEGEGDQQSQPEGAQAAAPREPASEAEGDRASPPNEASEAEPPALAPPAEPSRPEALLASPHPDASDPPVARRASDRVAPRRRKVARRREAGPAELDGSARSFVAALALFMVLGYLFSYAWTPDATLDSVRQLWAGRLTRNGGALYGLGRDLDRGARVPLAQLKAESGSLPGALLAFGLEPSSGQCEISAEWAYRSAANAGEGRAMLRLAQILGRVSPPRPKAVSELLRQAAEAGEPRAMWLYASRLRAGKGVERDPAQALVWIQRGAEAGHRDAQFLLASWLEIGHADTVPRDLPGSLRWYLRAARQGHPRARGEVERMLRRYPELEKEAER